MEEELAIAAAAGSPPTSYYYDYPNSDIGVGKWIPYKSYSNLFLKTNTSLP
jgi:hypothetical protein